MANQVTPCVSSYGWSRRSAQRGIATAISLLILLAPATMAYALRDIFSVELPVERPIDASSAIAQKSNDAQGLELGKPIERELAGGDTHSYQFALALGQYIHLIVDQRGIDVLVSVTGPDGKKLAEVDSPNGTQGRERVSLVADTLGSYRLDVRSPEKDAIAGRYEVKIDELRTANPQDNSRIAAQKAYTQGMQLLGQGTAESLQKSVASFEEALPLWQAVSDQGGEADTLNCLGRVFYELSETKKSLDFYNRALSLYRVLSDRAGEKSVLNDIGVVYSDLGEGQKSLDYYRQALALDQAMGDRTGEAVTLQNIGLHYKGMGEHQLALDYYGRGLTLHRLVGNRREEANTLLNIGALYRALGEFQKSLDYYTQSLALHRAVGNRREEATTLGNIGALHQAANEHQKALDSYKKALTLARDTGNRSYVATMLNNMGAVYQNMGENQKAIDHYSQALAIHQETSNKSGESLTLNNIGMYYKAIGEYQKALDYYDKALQFRRASGDLSGEAFTLFNIARLERDRGNLVEARNRIEVVLAKAELLRTKVTSPQLRASFFATVRKYHEFNIDLLMRLHRLRPLDGFDVLGLQSSESGRARSLLELLTEARAQIRQGADSTLLERERNLQQLISDRAEHQTRLLSGNHTKEQAAAAAKEIDALTTEYEQVQAQIRQAGQRFTALIQPAPLSLKEIQTDVLDGETLLLEVSLGEEKSFLWAVTPTSIKSFELRKRAEIEAVARRFYDLLIARNQPMPNETPEQRLLRLKSADAEYPKVAAALSQMVLGPVASQLGSKRLLIVSEGMLQYVPFAALPIPAAEGPRDGETKTNDSSRPVSPSPRRPVTYTPLIAEHEVINLPSASVLAVLRRETAGREAAAKTVAVLADPVFDNGDPRLGASSAEPVTGGEEASSADVRRSATESGLIDFVRLRFSRQEAEQIARLAPEGKTLKAVDFAASRAVATNAELGQYRILHFATHGLINNQHPELSGIVLSLVDQQGRLQNGFLRLYDIYNLKLGADLVVLSACQTALGKEVKGEGLVGLTRGFMYAGAPRVVSSLWRIDDRATAELMKRFYQKMLGEGLRAGAALRAAQVSMWNEKRWEAPYYWAAFTLQGEWK